MEAKPKVLILYTGGTIGMIKDPGTEELSNVDFNHIYDHVPELKRLNIELETISFDNPIDSSEINISHWKEIAQTVFENYLQYDGFVVLHGSDTMAYTASALSFMFEGLKKPVILTGSQLPIGIIRTDGKENLITAIEIAAAKGDDKLPIIQEVAVYFEYKLFRGNRSTKDSAENFEAFRSPNYRELAIAGVKINYNLEKLYRTAKSDFKVKSDLNDRIAHVKLFPGMNFSAYSSLFNRENIDGVLIESFGAGNAPSTADFKSLLKSFIQNGGVVLNITQCSSGSVQQGLYKSSSVFSEIGVLSGGDMTSEAALAKMMFTLNKENLPQADTLLTNSLRGELTD